MVRVKSIPKKYVPKPKPRLTGKGISKQKSRYNLRPIPGKASRASYTPEPDASLAPEIQQVGSTQPSPQSVATPSSSKIPPAANPVRNKKRDGPAEQVQDKQVGLVEFLKC